MSAKPVLTQLARRIAVVELGYAAAYLVAAVCDLGTTELALQRIGFAEGNVYSVNDAGYVAERAWAITLGMGVLIQALMVASLLRVRRVTQECLRRPIRSFGKVYLNPFAAGVADRAPIHVLSVCLAFVPLRMLASLNNLLIYKAGFAPLGLLIARVSRLTSPTMGFWIVMGSTLYLLACAAAPAAAAMIRWLINAPAETA